MYKMDKFISESNLLAEESQSELRIGVAMVQLSLNCTARMWHGLDITVFILHEFNHACMC